jgi:hypothetical protein
MEHEALDVVCIVALAVPPGAPPVTVSLSAPAMPTVAAPADDAGTTLAAGAGDGVFDAAGAVAAAAVFAAGVGVGEVFALPPQAANPTAANAAIATTNMLLIGVSSTRPVNQQRRS